MKTLLILALVFPVQERTSPAPVHLLDEEGYSKKLGSYIRGVSEWEASEESACISGAYKMEQPPRSFQWRLDLAAPNDPPVDKSYQGGIPNTESYGPSLPSGVPLGTVILYRTLSTRITIISASPFERLSVGIEETGSVRDNLLRETDVPLVERFARVLMARGAGMRLGESSLQTINGVSVNFATCRKSNRSFVRLEEWARARGWASTLSEDKNVVTLRKDGHAAQVPLASQSIKVSGAWQDMRDIVAEKDGVWWIGTDGCSMITGS